MVHDNAHRDVFVKKSALCLRHTSLYVRRYGLTDAVSNDHLFIRLLDAVLNSETPRCSVYSYPCYGIFQRPGRNDDGGDELNGRHRLLIS
jgi:hypothetical protein